MSDKQITSRADSVTVADEYEKEGLIVNYMLNPFILGGTNQKLLPYTMPQYTGSTEWGFYQARDLVALMTPRYESNWDAALGKAASKMGARSYSITSDIPLRAKRVQELINRADAGWNIQGYVPFIQVLFRSFALKGAYIEKSRDRNGRIAGLHYLNPLRCRDRNDLEYPVDYLNLKGEVIKMHRDYIHIIKDTPPVSIHEYDDTSTAVSRAYHYIMQMNAAAWYTAEKIRGEQPLSLVFASGVNQKVLGDAIYQTEQDNMRKNNATYKGVAIVPAFSDQNVSIAEVPLASLPDKFDPAQAKRDANLVYANALGFAPNELDPSLLGGGLSGTSTQATVLMEATKGNSLHAFSKQFTHFINSLDAQIQFSFEETDYNDMKMEEEVRERRAKRIQVYIDAGMITAQQGTNYAVDMGDLPDEFLIEDETGEARIEDDENADSQARQNADGGEVSAEKGYSFRY